MVYGSRAKGKANSKRHILRKSYTTSTKSLKRTALKKPKDNSGTESNSDPTPLQSSSLNEPTSAPIS